MADDYARVLEEEFGPSVVWEISLGSCMAQQLAVGHPNYVKELVLGVTGTRVNENGRDIVYTDASTGVRPRLAGDLRDTRRGNVPDWRRFIYPMITTTVG